MPHRCWWPLIAPSIPCCLAGEVLLVPCSLLPCTRLPPCRILGFTRRLGFHPAPFLLVGVALLVGSLPGLLVGVPVDLVADLQEDKVVTREATGELPCLSPMSEL
jgi:hypothetical protein